MISFIVPATDKKLISKLDASLKTLGMPYELIPIYKATSFFDAWRKGVAKAHGQYICFTHQDTEFIAFPDPAKYLKGKVGMIGTAGTTVLHKDQPWWFSKERYLGHILSGQIWNTSDKEPQRSVFGPFGEVVALDGVCLITTKKILEDVGIPDGYSWDYYDHVISLEYIKKGYKLLTVPLVIVHGSKGGDKRPSFFESEKKFKEEYLDKTWRV